MEEVEAGGDDGDGLEIYEVPDIQGGLRYTIFNEDSNARIMNLEELAPGLKELPREAPINEETEQKRKKGRPRKRK
jgi:hypothetical protein